MKSESVRPILSDYQDICDYVSDMLKFRKQTEAHFTVARACKKLRRVSPALISLIKQKKRRVTIDRVSELSKLMGLSAEEKKHFTHRVEWEQRKEEGVPQVPELKSSSEKRKDVTPGGILTDWINVYVKDLFQIPENQQNPDLIYSTLASVASPSRVDRSIQFLLNQGHLRKDQVGRVVVNENLVVSDTRIPSEKIRKFHKGTLQFAKQAIDSVPPDRRLANCLIVPLNSDSYGELMDIVDEFAEKLKKFAELDAQPGDQLHQLILNVSPIGGSE